MVLPHFAWNGHDDPTRRALPPHATAAIIRIEQAPEAARLGAPAQRFAARVRGCCADGSQPSDTAGELDIWLDATRLRDMPWM